MASAQNRILVVEDDQDIRESLEQVLENEGYVALCAKNGAEALMHIRDGACPKMVLLDLMMPVMNGWQFLEVRESEPELRSVPVVVLTAAGENATRDIKGVEILRKPLDITHLLEVIRKYCD